MSKINKSSGISSMQFTSCPPYSLPKFLQSRERNIKTQHNRKYQKPKIQIDSLQAFQEQLNSALKKKQLNYSQRSRRIKTQKNEESNKKQTKLLRRQMTEIKELLKKKSDQKSMTKKFQSFLDNIEQRKKDSQKKQTSVSNQVVLPQIETSIYKAPSQINSNLTKKPYVLPPQYNYAYVPQTVPFIPSYQLFSHHCHRDCGHNNQKRRKYDISDDQSEFQETFYKKRKKRKGKYQFSKNNYYPINKQNKARNRLRKVFFVVAYTVFIKKQAKRLTEKRKMNLKIFWQTKFQSQINNIKNWFLDAFKYAFSIVLEKGKLSFIYFSDKSQKIRLQKQKFILQIIHIGLKKLQQMATPQKISLFSETLYHLCFRNSYCLDKFWTAYEMEQFCISQKYGFIRADESMQKFLLGVMFFIKLFTFNMLVQPYKFDANNFAKNQEPISSNMKIIGSVFYQMMKQIVEQYRLFPRDSFIYTSGNWLHVNKDFIVECSQPLVINRNPPQEGQYISGLFSMDLLEGIQEFDTWDLCQEKIRKIIDIIHKQLVLKAKLMRKNLKYNILQ